MAENPRRIIVGDCLQHGATGDAISTQPMQDGPIEAGPPCDLRIGVQRIAITVEPVEQRLSRASRELQSLIGGARGQGMWLRGTFGGTSEPAIAACKDGTRQCNDLFRFVGPYRLVDDHGALVGALVERANRTGSGA